jgi:hypothetical protein
VMPLFPGKGWAVDVKRAPEISGALEGYVTFRSRPGAVS